MDEISDAVLKQEENVWLTTLDNQQGVSGRGQNKLRTYRLMKCEYKTEDYCLLRLPLKHRSAFAKYVVLWHLFALKLGGMRV